MQNLHTIIAKYLPATNTRPSRIKLFSTRFCDSVVISYQSDSTVLDAIEYLKNKGFEIVGKSWNEKTGENYILTSTFKNISK